MESKPDARNITVSHSTRFRRVPKYRQAQTTKRRPMWRFFCHHPPLRAVDVSSKSPRLSGVARLAAGGRKTSPHNGTWASQSARAVTCFPLGGRAAAIGQGGPPKRTLGSGRPALPASDGGFDGQRATVRRANGVWSGTGGKTTTIRESRSTETGRRAAVGKGRIGGGRKRPAIPLPRSRLSRRGNATVGKCSILSFLCRSFFCAYRKWKAPSSDFLWIEQRY